MKTVRDVKPCSRWALGAPTLWHLDVGPLWRSFVTVTGSTFHCPISPLNSFLDPCHPLASCGSPPCRHLSALRARSRSSGSGGQRVLNAAQRGGGDKSSVGVVPVYPRSIPSGRKGLPRVERLTRCLVCNKSRKSQDGVFGGEAAGQAGGQGVAQGPNVEAACSAVGYVDAMAICDDGVGGGDG